MRKIIFFFFLLGAISSCSHDRTKILTGKWQAISVMQNDEKLDVDYSLIQFNFNNNGIYQFKSTLDYEEAGNYLIEEDKLITWDTTDGNKMKRVLINQLDSDTLKLRMKNQNDWMLLTMIKQAD